MAIIIFLILSTGSAFLYGLVFKNRLTYLTMDNRVISERKKTMIFRIQVILSVIFAILIVKIVKSYFPSSEEDADLHFVILLSVFYVLVLLGSGYAIDLGLKLTSPQMKLYSMLVENPDLLTEVEDLKTDVCMKQEEFWQFVNKEDKPLSPEEYRVRLKELFLELHKYHPIKHVEFYNTLCELRKELFSAEIYLIYHYVWGRKYEDDHFEQFMEFIIAQGRTELEKVKLDLNRIASLDLNLIKLNRLSLTSVFVDLYMASTQKFFPMKEDTEMMNILIGLKENDQMLKEKYAVIYQKYKS